MSENILKEILQEYDRIRLKEEMALREREKQVMEKIPEIATIRQTIVELLAQKSKEIIQNPKKATPSDIKQLQNKIARLKAREAEILVKNGFPADFLVLHYRCPICKDTGFVGKTVKEKCRCLIQKIVTRIYKLSETNNLEKQNFDTFDPAVFPDTPLPGSKLTQREYMINVKTVLENYLQEFPHNARKTILFTGKTGLGKTFLLNCLAKAVLEKGYTVIQITAYKLFNRLFESLLKNRSENEYMLTYLFDVDVLIVDDLGTETLRNNLTSEWLFNILNERFLKEKYTFLSTNLNLAELKERYSDRITSRLFDKSNTIIIKFKGEDIRIKNKSQ